MHISKRHPRRALHLSIGVARVFDAAPNFTDTAGALE